MEKKYYWEIESLEILESDNDFENIIKAINWIYYLEIDNKTFKTTGIYQVPPPEVNNFKNLELITEEELINWLESTLSLELMQQDLDNLLLNETKPKIKTIKFIK
jgi:hypothetical protein